MDHSHSEPQFQIDPEAHIATLTAQRNQATDAQAMWQTIALQERAKVESLTVELKRLSDSNALDTTPDAGSKSHSPG